MGNSREKILECALALFASRGYDAVSVGGIAEAAGITKPTLYYYFGSKEGLFTALLELHYGRLQKMLEKVCRYEPVVGDYYRDVYPVLTDIARTYFSFAEKNGAFFMMSASLLFAPAQSDAAKMAAPHQKNQYELIRQTFAHMAQVHGSLRNREDGMAWRFLAFIYAQIALWRRGQATLTPEDAQGATKQFMHGIFS